ncbi:multimodular transpeptidase-transglycosylase [Vibrio astriarenae]|nr:multimodular transpeptidase-transglycosylase [Vibrio sp. C7]
MDTKEQHNDRTKEKTGGEKNCHQTQDDGKKAHCYKNSSQKEASSKTQNEYQKPKRGWVGTLWSLTWKSGLALLAVLVVVGIYLDTIVRQKFDGQLFDLLQSFTRVF